MWLITAEIVGLLPLFIMVGFVYWQRREMSKDERREAITTELTNLPGASLQEQQEQIADAMINRMVFAIMIGLAAAMAIIARRVPETAQHWSWLDFLIVLAILGVGVFSGQRIRADMVQRKKLREALRAEQATAQELGLSLAGNNRIFNDIRAKDFNIDHVVVTPVAVFAIETKSRLKPTAGKGAAAVKVTYDGKQLGFPGWSESKPIEQAARQAKWLREHLKNATGEHFPVIAVLALPGWFVENTARITDDMVRVINPKNSQWLLLPEKRPAQLDPAAVQRASFAVEKLANANETTK